MSICTLESLRVFVRNIMLYCACHACFDDMSSSVRIDAFYSIKLIYSIVVLIPGRNVESGLRISCGTKVKNLGFCGEWVFLVMIAQLYWHRNNICTHMLHWRGPNLGSPIMSFEYTRWFHMPYLASIKTYRVVSFACNSGFLMNSFFFRSSPHHDV